MAQVNILILFGGPGLIPAENPGHKSRSVSFSRVVFGLCVCFLSCFAFVFEVFPDGGPDPRPVDSHLKIPEMPR